MHVCQFYSPDNLKSGLTKEVSTFLGGFKIQPLKTKKNDLSSEFSSRRTFSVTQPLKNAISVYLINELKLGHNQVFLKACEFICPK